MNNMEKKKYANPSFDVIVIQDQNIVTIVSEPVEGPVDDGNDNKG